MMKMFPVMVDKKYQGICPADVPFGIVALHEKQCRRNHSQSAQRLAERGGLAPCELVAVLEDRDWKEMDHREAISRLIEILATTDDRELGEKCMDCDRRYSLVWHAHDHLWQRIVGSEGGLLCPDCFDARCEKVGVFLRWHANPE